MVCQIFWGLLHSCVAHLVMFGFRLWIYNVNGECQYLCVIVELEFSCCCDGPEKIWEGKDWGGDGGGIFY